MAMCCKSMLLSLFLLVSSIVVSGAEIESSSSSTGSGRGFLLVEKDLSTAENIAHLYAVVVPINVNVTVYNVGDSAAYSISVQDEWPQSFQVKAGSLKSQFEEIASGQSKSFNYTVVPTVEGDVESFRASVRYHAVVEGDAQVAFSTAASNVTVVSEAVFQKLTAKHYFEWLFFSSIFGGCILVPLALWLQIQTNFKHGLPHAAFKSD